GQTTTRSGGFTVVMPPPTLSLAFVGKVRDKVGQGNTAFAPDGALDGTFRIVLQGGAFPRTVIRLVLNGGGVWDTDTATPHWALGDGGVGEAADGGADDGGDGAAGAARRGGDESERASGDADGRVHSGAAAGDAESGVPGEGTGQGRRRQRVVRSRWRAGREL